MDPQGVWHEDDHEIGENVVGYYADLFCSNRLTEFTRLLDVVQPKVLDDMNRMLNMPFQDFEVYSALKQMYPLKSPGSDGMSPLFF